MFLQTRFLTNQRAQGCFQKLFVFTFLIYFLDVAKNELACLVTLKSRCFGISLYPCSSMSRQGPIQCKYTNDRTSLIINDITFLILPCTSLYQRNWVKPIGLLDETQGKHCSMATNWNTDIVETCLFRYLTLHTLRFTLYALFRYLTLWIDRFAVITSSCEVQLSV